jgi:hypothetical protein
MFPSNLQCSPITFSVAESRSRVYPNEHFVVLGLLLVMDFGAVDYGSLIPVSSRCQHLRVNDLACLLPGHVATQSCAILPMLRRPLDTPVMVV